MIRGGLKIKFGYFNVFFWSLLKLRILLAYDQVKLVATIYLNSNLERRRLAGNTIGSDDARRQ